MQGVNEIVERIRRSTVQISDGGGAGAGIVWDSSGVIVTNAHVVRSNDVALTDFSGRKLRGRVTRRDPEEDLAIVTPAVHDLEPAPIGDSNRIRPGEVVIAVGNPLGVAGAAAWGIIHSTGPMDFGSRRTWIQADIRLAPGNSGGALVTASGEVIGVNTLVYRGLGLAAPANEAGAFVRGETERAFLGVEMVQTPHGLMVVNVEPESLASRAGVTQGDIIQCSPEELRRLLGGVRQFGEAEIPISRAGRSRTLRVYAGRASGARAA